MLAPQLASALRSISDRFDIGADFGRMARRADPVPVILAEAPLALSFPGRGLGTFGPELTADGIAYHRVGLHVEMGNGHPGQPCPVDP